MSDKKKPYRAGLKRTISLPSEREDEAVAGVVERLLGRKLEIPDRDRSQDREKEESLDLRLEKTTRLENSALEDRKISSLAITSSLEDIAKQAVIVSNEKTARLEIIASLPNQSGYLSYPNVFWDYLMPQLTSSEQAVLGHLYRLCFGFGKQQCVISLEQLGRRAGMSARSVHTITASLEEKGIVTKTGYVTGKGKPQGIIFSLENIARLEVIAGLKKDSSSNEKTARLEKFATNKEEEDPLKEIDHHQREVMKMYESITGNRWKTADSKAYEEIKRIGLETIEQAMRVTKERAMNRPNSLKYFIKEILSVSNPSSQSKRQRKQAIGKIVERIRTRLIGVGSYSTSDFIEDCKRECAREGIVWDNDLFNEVAGF